MGWEKGRYYTRSTKVNGRVEREYFGCGKVAEMIAMVDELQREERRAKAEALRQEMANSRALDQKVSAICNLADLMARAAMVSAGFHRHHRGDWRRRRVNKQK